MFLRPRRPKNLRCPYSLTKKYYYFSQKKTKITKLSPSFPSLSSVKKQPVPIETKDSSSADHYLPSNKVRGWPPQNDKPQYPAGVKSYSRWFQPPAILQALPSTPILEPNEILYFIEKNSLMGRGLACYATCLTVIMDTVMI
jgi:hypothetical protein